MADKIKKIANEIVSSCEMKQMLNELFDKYFAGSDNIIDLKIAESRAGELQMIRQQYDDILSELKEIGNEHNSATALISSLNEKLTVSEGKVILLEERLRSKEKELTDANSGFSREREELSRKNTEILQKYSIAQEGKREADNKLRSMTIEFDKAKKMLSEETDRLNRENRCLKQENSDILRTKEALEKRKNETEDELRALRTSLDSNIVRLSDTEKKLKFMSEEVSYYKGKYSEVERVHKIYCSLDISRKQQLKAIFHGDSIFSFLSVCGNWDSIKGIWGAVRYSIIEKNGEYANELREIFLFMFRVYSEGRGNQDYRLICPGTGDRFDSDVHSIIGNNTDGIISETLLEGMTGAGGKILCKALVRVQ